MKTPKGPKILVKITDELIRESVGKDSSHCMIAEAVKTSFPNGQSVAVDLQTIRVSDPGRRLRYIYLTPRIAQVALLQFDNATLPEAFQFQLRGAHVIRMATPGPRKTQPQSERRKVSIRKARHGAEALAKAKLVNRDISLGTGAPGRGGAVIDRVGGKAPPTTAFAHRRSFGLRALGRPSQKIGDKTFEG